MAHDEFLLVGQKAFITNGKGELLVLIDPDRGLDLPGGKIQVGEKNLDEALKREVREETSLEIDVSKPFVRWYREGSDNSEFAGKPFFIVGFYCKYLAGEVVLSDEHTEYHWVDKTSYQQYKGELGYHRAIEIFFMDA